MLPIGTIFFPLIVFHFKRRLLYETYSSISKLFFDDIDTTYLGYMTVYCLLCTKIETVFHSRT